MWFSPWRRILRGRSGDTKPSGLRAGTKFVEEDTGVEYTYDPVMQDWKKKVAPYSAIVCKDGSTVWAEDSDGKTIASGEAGVDDASVIQSAIDSLPVYESGYWEGYYATIVLRGRFILKEKIKIPKSFIKFTGNANVHVDMSDDFAFEVYNKDTIDKALPRNVCFSGLNFLGGPGRKLFNFRYCQDWIIENCFIDSFKTVLRLERTWGEQQVMKHCVVVGCNPDNNKGAIDVVVPTEATGGITGVTFENCRFILENQNAYVINVEHTAGLVRFINCYQEKYGGFAIFKAGASKWQILGGKLATYAQEKEHTYFIKAEDDVVLENFFISNLVTHGHIDVYDMRYSYIENCRIGFEYKEKFPFELPIIRVRNKVIDLHLSDITFGYYDKQQPMMELSGEISGVFISNIFLRDKHCGQYFLRANSTGSYFGIHIFNVVFSDFAANRTWSGDAYAFSLPNGRFTLEKIRFHNIGASTFYPYDTDTINNLANIKIEEVEAVSGWFTKNSGTQTFDGDGTTTDFLIGDHGLVVTDTSRIVVKVTPVSSDAIAASPCVGYVDPADNTKIRVKFASAPASGSGNVKIVWEAQVVS